MNYLKLLKWVLPAIGIIALLLFGWYFANLQNAVQSLEKENTQIRETAKANKKTADVALKQLQIRDDVETMLNRWVTENRQSYNDAMKNVQVELKNASPQLKACSTVNVPDATYDFLRGATGSKGRN